MPLFTALRMDPEAVHKHQERTHKKRASTEDAQAASARDLHRDEPFPQQQPRDGGFDLPNKRLDAVPDWSGIDAKFHRHIGLRMVVYTQLRGFYYLPNIG